MRFLAGVGGGPGICCAFSSFFVSILLACMAGVSVARDISIGFDDVRFFNVRESDFEMKVWTIKHVYFGGSSIRVLTDIADYFVAIHTHESFKIMEIGTRRSEVC
jgi:hypothetical protein